MQCLASNWRCNRSMSTIDWMKMVDRHTTARRALDLVMLQTKGYAKRGPMTLWSFWTDDVATTGDNGSGAGAQTSL